MKSKLFALAVLFTPVVQAAINPILDAEDRRQVDSPAVKAAAGDKSPSLRERAATAYGRIQSPHVINSLIELAKDKDAKVRAAAAFSLGQFGWKAEFADGREGEIQLVLLGMADDKDTDVRVRAVEALGKIALDKTPDLMLPLLLHADAKMRAAAVYSLFRHRMVLRLRDPEKEIKEIPAPVFEQLVKLTEDKDVQVKQNVAYYFARNADARAETAVAALTLSKDHWTRLYAVMALGKMKAKKSTAALEKAIKDKESDVRVAALLALGTAGAQMAPYAFLMRDKSYHVRTALAQGLDTANLETMLAKDESLAVRAQALKTLASNKTDSLGAWLAEFSKNPNWVIREAAVQAGEKLAESEREKFLMLAMADADPNVRGAALDMIGKIPSSSAFKQLENSLQSKELIERGTAVTALKDRKEKSEAVTLMWKTYQDSQDNKWVETREEMIDFIAKTKNSTTTEYLNKALSDPDPGVRSKAQKALADRGQKTALANMEANLTFSPYREAELKKNPTVMFYTKKGNFTVECYAKDAPIHCADLVGHVKRGYYNGLIWHRVVPNFVIQGGDPDGTGWGGAGYSLRAEVNTIPYKRGTLGMPRSNGFDTGGSQLFFTYIPTPHLDGQYTVFGQVTKGMDVVDRLERGDTIVKAEIR